MKAITVEPHNPGSACLEDIPEPDVRDGSVLVEADRSRRLRDGRRDHRRQVRMGASGQDATWCSGTNRSAGSSTQGRLAACRKETWSSASCAVPTPCRARTARSVNGTCAATANCTGARHQEIDGFMSERWQRTRARIRDEDRPVARPARRAAGTHDRRHEGLGAGPHDRPARVLGAAHGARHWRRTNGSAGGAGWQAARARGPRPQSRRIGRQARPGSRPGGDGSRRLAPPTWGSSPT